MLKSFEKVFFWKRPNLANDLSGYTLEYTYEYEHEMWPKKLKEKKNRNSLGNKFKQSARRAMLYVFAAQIQCGFNFDILFFICRVTWPDLAPLLNMILCCYNESIPLIPNVYSLAPNEKAIWLYGWRAAINDGQLEAHSSLSHQRKQKY